MMHHQNGTDLVETLNAHELIIKLEDCTWTSSDEWLDNPLVVKDVVVPRREEAVGPATGWRCMYGRVLGLVIFMQNRCKYCVKTRNFYNKNL